MKPKGMTRRSFLASTSAAVAPFFLGRTAAGETRRPNVVIIMTDDQGAVDMGAYGAAELHTPNMDALAARGIRFTQFYSAAPVCSPSRAGLLTGRFPCRAGVPGNVSCTRGDAGMPTEQVTIAEALHEAGYATAHVGKWHLGYTDETMPNAQGFDFSFGHMGGCIDNYSHFFYWSGPNRHDLWRNGEEVYAEGRFFQDLMLEEASKFIDAHRDEPFFLYFAMNAPHYPYQGDARWLKRYRDEGLAYPRDLYAAFLSTQDERIGALLDKIDALGLREDTLVILQSDNGHSTEERAHFGGGKAQPYRGAKFSLFEGGIRMPALISWPGHLEQGGVRDQAVHSCDWFPTIADLAGVDLSSLELDGKSVVEVLASPSAKTPHERLYWHVGQGPNAQWAVREGDWKLIGNVRDTTDGAGGTKDSPKRFLSNLAEDVAESKNYADEYPEKVERLEALYTAWETTF